MSFWVKAEYFVLALMLLGIAAAGVLSGAFGKAQPKEAVTPPPVTVVIPREEFGSPPPASRAPEARAYRL